MAHEEAKLHPAYRYSRVARPLDPRYRTNAALLILVPLLGAAAAGWAYHQGAAVEQAALTFGAAALAVFLTWALGREVAPDSNAAAFIAVALAVPPFVLGADAAFLEIVLALFLARVVNRCVGPPAFATDLVIVGALLLAVAVWRDAWAFAFVAAVAFALDGMLERPKGVSWLVALWALIVGGAVMWWGPLGIKQLVGTGEIAATVMAPVRAVDPPLLAALAVIAGAAVLAAATSPPPRARCDIQDEPLDHGRVAWGAIVVVLCALAGLFDGADGALALYPLWAALAASAAGRLLPDRAGAAAPAADDESAVASDLDAVAGPSDEVTVGRGA